MPYGRDSCCHRRSNGYVSLLKADSYLLRKGRSSQIEEVGGPWVLHGGKRHAPSGTYTGLSVTCIVMYTSLTQTLVTYMYAVLWCNLTNITWNVSVVSIKPFLYTGNKKASNVNHTFYTPLKFCRTAEVC